jgi:DNA-binding XRE family transcriptional regulator
MKAPYQLLRAARAALGIEHVALAEKAGVSKRSLVRIETLQSVSEKTRERVQTALEAEGICFVSGQEEHGPGIRLAEQILEPPYVRRQEPRRQSGQKAQS